VTHKVSKVVTYSSYKGEERPVSFVISGEEIEVKEILKMWIEEDRRAQSRRRVFIIRGSDKKIHKIYYDEKSLHWICDDE